MKRIPTIIISLLLGMSIALIYPGIALAQSETPTDVQPNLTLTTLYPSQVVEAGEVVTIRLNLHATGEAQTAKLEMAELPEGWSASFRGGGRIVHAVYVEADTTESVELRLEQPQNAPAGEYKFVVRAQGEKRRAELPIMLIIQEKLPASLSFTCELPTIKGSPTTTFRYTATLKNEGDEELTVNLITEAPEGFLAKFKLSGQEVTSFPLGANQSKTVNIELDPLVEVPSGNYPFTVYADAGDLQASLDLTAQVTGQVDLNVAGVGGLLSGKANAGKETTLPIVVRNTGSAPAQGVELTSTAPSGWTISFEPKVIAEIPAGGQVEVTAKIKPADKAVAGDYMVTIRARPVDGASEAADFRITVTTSTLWGVIGIALIAVAVGVVALAVMRFGRR